MMFNRRHADVTGRRHSGDRCNGDPMNPIRHSSSNPGAIFIDNALPVRHPRFVRDDSDRFDPSLRRWTEAPASRRETVPLPLLEFLKGASSRARKRGQSVGAPRTEPHITRFHHGPADEQSHRGRCLTFPWTAPRQQRSLFPSSRRHVDPDGTAAVA